MTQVSAREVNAFYVTTGHGDIGLSAGYRNRYSIQLKVNEGQMMRMWGKWHQFRLYNSVRFNSV